MSNDSTKPTGSWGSKSKDNIEYYFLLLKKNVKYYLLVFLLACVGSYVFDIGIVGALVWCYLFLLAWWLVRKAYSLIKKN